MQEIHNNYSGFLLSYGIILQSDIQSYFKKLVCGALLSDINLNFIIFNFYLFLKTKTKVNKILLKIILN